MIFWFTNTNIPNSTHFHKKFALMVLVILERQERTLLFDDCGYCKNHWTWDNIEYTCIQFIEKQYLEWSLSHWKLTWREFWFPFIKISKCLSKNSTRWFDEHFSSKSKSSPCDRENKKSKRKPSFMTELNCWEDRESLKTALSRLYLCVLIHNSGGESTVAFKCKTISPQRFLEFRFVIY